MNNPLILPKHCLHHFFGMPLREDFTVDVAAIKEELPAVYWQLPTSITTPQRDNKLATATAIPAGLIRQRLWCGNRVFSQIIVLTASDHLRLLYLQLLPTSPPDAVGSNDYRVEFLRKYRLCLRKTLLNLNTRAKHYGVKRIDVTLINPMLVEIFLHSGYRRAKSDSRDSNAKKYSAASPVVEEFKLVRTLTRPA